MHQARRLSRVLHDPVSTVDSSCDATKSAGRWLRLLAVAAALPLAALPAATAAPREKPAAVKPAAQKPALLGEGAGETICATCREGELGCGESIASAFTPEDCRFDDDSAIEIWRFTLESTMRVRIDLGSDAVDTFLFLLDASCQFVESDDDGGDGTNSRIEASLPPGEWFIGANTYSAGEFGDFTLGIECSVAASCEDCVAGSVECQSIFTGTYPQIGCDLPGGVWPNSVDLVELQVDGGPVRIDLQSSDFDTVLFLTNEECGVIDLNDDCGGLSVDSCLETFLDPGSYRIGVSSFSSGESGDYALRVTCLPLGDCEDCFRADLECGATASGEPGSTACESAEGEHGGRDIWRLRVDTPTRVTWTPTGDEEFFWSLAGRACDTIVEPFSSTAGPQSVVLLPDVYHLDVRLAEGATSGYALEMSCDPSDLCSDCVVGPLACGEEISETLDFASCPLDEEVRMELFEVTLDEPRRLTATVTSNEFSPLAIILDEACFAVAIGGDTGDFGVATVDVPPGTYLIGVAGTGGDYSMSVSCEEIRDCVDCEVGELRCGGSVRAELAEEDCLTFGAYFTDFWRLDLPEDAELTISLSSPDFDTYLLLYGDGCLVQDGNDDCDDGTVDSCLETFLPAGTYWIAASSFGEFATGAYDLSITCPGVDICEPCLAGDIGALPAITSELTAESCLRTDGSPVEYWSLDVATAGRYELEVASEAFDAVLSVHDADCAELARNDDCRDLSLDPCLALDLEPGLYRVGVGGAFSGELGTYRLTVRQPGQDGVVPGDCTADGRVDVSDAICLLEHLFRGRPTRLACDDGDSRSAASTSLVDANGDARLDVSDAVRLLRHLFRGGEGHALGQDCAVIDGCPGVCAP